MYGQTQSGQPAKYMNRRTKRRTWLTVGITVGAILVCVVAALIAGLDGWWIFSMAMAGLVVGLAVGVLIPAAIEDGEANEAEHRVHGERQGIADRGVDDGPLPQ